MSDNRWPLRLRVWKEHGRWVFEVYEANNETGGWAAATGERASHREALHEGLYELAAVS